MHTCNKKAHGVFGRRPITRRCRKRVILLRKPFPCNKKATPDYQDGLCIIHQLAEPALTTAEGRDH
jgi:hypothetical protein